MPVRKLKPITPAQRFRIVNGFDAITTDKPEKSLLESKKSTGGRNNKGKMTSRYIGGGHKKRYRIIDFKRNKFNIPAEVKSIEMHHTMVEKAEPGDNVGFNVRGLSATDIRRGDVAGYTDTAPTFVRHDETFVGQIQLMDIPKAVSVGYTPVFHAHTAQVAVRFQELLEKTSKGQKEANPSFLKTGDAALIRFAPTKPMAIEQMDKFPELSRFAIRDMGKTVAAGVCLKIEKKA